MRCLLSVDLGIGAKNQSYSVVAGSPRNVPQDSHYDGSHTVKSLIGCACTERCSLPVKLRMYEILYRSGWVSGVKLDTEKRTI